MQSFLFLDNLLFGLHNKRKIANNVSYFFATRSKDAKLNIEKWQHIFYAKCVNFVFDTMKHLLSRALCLYVILMCGKTANENNYKATKWLRWASMLYYITLPHCHSF